MTDSSLTFSMTIKRENEREKYREKERERMTDRDIICIIYIFSLIHKNI